MSDKYQYPNEEFYDRSGCAPLAATLAVIVLFWVVVLLIYLFK